MSEEVEPSILDYARFYGIAVDHRKWNPLQHCSVPEDILALLEDPPNVFQIDSISGALQLERLSVGAEAAVLLSSIKELGEQSRRFDEDVDLDVHPFQKLKQELPILLTDHELDLQNFARQVVPDLENEHLPLEKLDEEADEGLEWPSVYHELRDKFFSETSAERLDIPRDGFLYLQDALSFRPDGGTDVLFEQHELLYRKKSITDPVTPPLLPRSPEISAFVPSSDTGRLDFLSDHTSPTREEAQAVDRIIFKEDAIILKRDHGASRPDHSDPMLLDPESIGDIYSSLKGISDPPSSPPVKRVKIQDRKVDSPLTPPVSVRPPPWETKSVSFSDALHEVMPEIPSPIAKPEDISSDDIDALFADIVAPVALKAERSIEQEQLQEADKTRRVEVPIMDFSLPTPPWSNINTASDDYKEILSDIKKTHLDDHVWPIESRIERELKWTPFPAALGRITMQEDIPDDGATAVFLAQPERVDTSTLTWKSEGLRILDDLNDSDDEDLEYGTFPEAKDLDSLIRKRRFELQETETYNAEPEEQNLVQVPPNPPPISEAGRKLPRLDPPTNNTEVQTDPTKHHAIPLNQPFSAFGALEEYMTVRTGKIRKLDLVETPYFPPKPATNNPVANIHPNPRPTSGPSTQVHPPVPTPSLTIPTTPHTFIISTSLLQNRKLIRQIQSLYPTADFISRDFTLHALFPPQPPISEADLLLSASTGVIFTSLPHLTQLPLPGHQSYHSQNNINNQPSFRTRIQTISTRYATLIILITTPWPLSETDTETLTAFTAFAASLPTPIHLISVPKSPSSPTSSSSNTSANDDVLARYAVAQMLHHGVPTPLLQDETLWEIWLRRAGMNAFAAQAVLGALKQPPPSDTERGQDSEMDDQGAVWGLPAFVLMGAEERRRRFEGMMGGNGVLERVGRVIDEGW